MAPPYVTMSWIGLTSVTPLSALLIAWTLVSIHRKRTKSILLLSIVYAQLVFQLFNFAYSTLTLLKMENLYVKAHPYFVFVFNALVFFKSLALLSLHLEEFYKIKSPSNYLLNINSSLLKYHLLVVLFLSLMGAYFLRGLDIVPAFHVSDRFLIAAYLTFQALTILLAIFLLGLKFYLQRHAHQLNVLIGTNSTSSSANLFGLHDGCGSSGGRQGIAASGVAAINLLINASLLGCSFWVFWLPASWPVVNVILWTQVTESLLTPSIYWAAHARRRSVESQKSSVRYHQNDGGGEEGQNNQFQSIANGSLCFNNGEFQYFAGGKHNRRRSETGLNNAMSSQYDTFDSFHQARSYTDSLRCASVTTIANDDFEFLPRGQAAGLPPHLQLQSQNPQFQQETMTIKREQKEPSPNIETKRDDVASGRNGGRGKSDMVTASLSMNDLDLLESEEREHNTSSMDSGATQSERGKYKYKKNSHRIKKRFTNKSLTRRVLSLESLHSNLNESHLAFLDTGERVIVFTTDFI